MVGSAYWLGQPAETGRDQVALLTELLLQRRQRRDRGLQARLLLQHVRAADRAEFEALLHHVQLLPVQPDDLLRRVDLRLQRRLGQQGADQVGGQGEIGGFQLVALVVRLRLQSLDLPAHQPEHVQGVGDVERAGIVVERRDDAARNAERRQRHLLARGVGRGADRGEERPLRRAHVLARLAQGRLRRPQIGVGLQRLRHQRGDLRRVEQLPPLARHVGAGAEALRGAAQRGGGDGLHRQRRVRSGARARAPSAARNPARHCIRPAAPPIPAVPRPAACPHATPFRGRIPFREPSPIGAAEPTVTPPGARNAVPRGGDGRNPLPSFRPTGMLRRVTAGAARLPTLPRSIPPA